LQDGFEIHKEISSIPIDAWCWFWRLSVLIPMKIMFFIKKISAITLLVSVLSCGGGGGGESSSITDSEITAAQEETAFTATSVVILAGS
jgi:hypothetical protein